MPPRAPSPLAILRKDVAPGQNKQKSAGIDKYRHLAFAIATAAIVTALWSKQKWVQRWLFSGVGIESLLLLYSSRKVSVWILLPLLNLIYVVVSLSWITSAGFSFICYFLVLATCIRRVRYASVYTRSVLRRVLAPLHFTADKIACFNLPGLEIDIGRADGLMVVRGITFRPFEMTIMVHGIELGFQLQHNAELAVYIDEVEARLFQGIEFGEVYGALRSESSKHELGEKQTSQSHIQISGDDEAEKYYSDTLQDISSSSRISTSRDEAKRGQGGDSESLSQQQLRAKTCTALLNVSSVPHTPSRSISVSEILEKIPRWLRQLISRLPFLIRSILMPLSYVHPITVTSISASANGNWLTGPMLEHSRLQRWSETDESFKEVYDRFYQWIADADFCFDFDCLDGLTQVPIRKVSNIVAWLRCGNMTAFRVSEGDGVETALHLHGADATFVIPSFLLPCHEHVVPQEEETTDIGWTGHGSFPVTINQTLLNFVSELTNASKVFEMEAEQQMTDEEDSSKSKLAGSIKHPRHNAKAVVKKLMASNVVDDQWIAELMGKLATQLGQMQGEVGYSGEFAVALKPYRRGMRRSEKLLE